MKVSGCGQVGVASYVCVVLFPRLACPTNRYGPNCVKSCFCYGRSHCHPIHGNCTCEAGLTGPGCWKG